MRRILLTSIAALTALSVVTSTAPKAHAFFVAPAVAAAVLGGALVTGAAVGSASTTAPFAGGQTVVVEGQPYYGPVSYTYEAPAAYYYGDRMCRATSAIVRHHWRRIYICQ